MNYSLALVAIGAVPILAFAQQPLADLSGTIRDTRGPVAGANVFVLGTLDGTLTDGTGAFRFQTPRQHQYLVAVRHEGHRDIRQMIPDSSRSGIVVMLDRTEAQRMGAVMVEAGRFVAADEPGATLSPIEIVSIPGTAGDINRAIQTLPGTQQVDEGTGLFVRGGDFTETRVFLNEALLLNPAQLQRPAGTFVGTFDPFLMDAVYFTSGGFGARYGDALSAIVALRTQARPASRTITLSTGLAAFGANVAVPGPAGTGLRMVANRNDLTPVLRVNGSRRQFSDPPHGIDLTASGFWEYSATGRISLFSTQQDGSLEALNEIPSVTDTFAVKRRDQAFVATWHDLFGKLAPTVAISSSMIRSHEAFGSFVLSTPRRLAQLSAFADYAIDERLTLRGGAETNRTTTGVTGSVPASGDDQAPGAQVRLFDLERRSTRDGAFLEFDLRPDPTKRLVVGGRTDHSSSGEGSTFDPRVSAAWRATRATTFTAAWGIYHQTADPLLGVLRQGGEIALPSMRAVQSVVGVQLGDSGASIRVELYDKRYSDLVLQTRDFTTATGGTGRAHGVDVIARFPAYLGVATRIVYSGVESRRTDAASGRQAPAQFDVPHTATFVVSRAFAGQVTLGGALRYASGRPFTPVVNAARAPDGTWTPQYGAPGSLRLPAYARVDLSASVFRVMQGGTQVVGYLALTNVLDRPNVYQWRYSPDYTTRYEVASIFNRSLYFGGVLTFTGR